mmetsp:Transcript_20992/g.59053  ORF Transcript_20992/g.59053 Transcript_20992/m.59053 type:complete len:766 (-) Transcript_20992:219-2516(-)
MFKSKKSKTGGGEGVDVETLSSTLKAKPLGEWTQQDVSNWLASIGLDRYRDLFFYNEIDGEMLLDIDDDDLLALPIERLGDRKKILRRLKEHRGATGNTGSSVTMSQTGTRGDGSQVSQVDSYSDLDTVGALAGSVSVKCVYNDDIRSLKLNKNDDYEAFKAKLKKEYGSSRFAAKYKDEDGDLVTIRNNQDIQLVIAAAAHARIKLIVFSTKSKKKSKSKSKSKSSKSSKGKDASAASGSESEGHSSTSLAADANIMENFIDAVVVINRRGVVNFFNEAAEDMFGWDREEVLGKNVSMLMNENDARQHNKYLRRYRREGKARVIGKGRAVMAKDRDGELFKIWLSLSEANESFTGIVRRIEEGERSMGVKGLVKASVAHKFEALEHYPKPTLVINKEGVVQFANKVVEKSFGFGSSNLEGHVISVLCPAVFSTDGEDLLHDYIIKVRDRRERGKLLDQKNQRDVICYKKDGNIISYIAEFSHQDVDGHTYYIIMFEPNDDDHAAGGGTILAAQRAVIANLVIPGIVMDEKCIIQEANASAREIFGYGLSELLGRNVNMLIPAGEVHDNHNTWIANYAKTGKGRNPDGTSNVVGKNRNVVGKTKDGRNVKLSLSVTMLAEDDGRKVFTGILQFVEEVAKSITDSDILKQQIMVIEQLIIPSMIITHDSKIRAFNPHCEKLFGWTEKELLNKDVVCLIPLGEIRERHAGYITRFHEGKKNAAQSLVVGKGRKITARHKDGHNITVKLSVTERKDGNALSIYTGTFT